MLASPFAIDRLVPQHASGGNLRSASLATCTIELDHQKKIRARFDTATIPRAQGIIRAICAARLVPVLGQHRHSFPWSNFLQGDSLSRHFDGPEFSSAFRRDLVFTQSASCSS